MRKTFLLLSFCTLLAACDSGSPKSDANETSIKAASSAELSSDSTSGTNLAAVAHQPQIDTSTSKIGTEHAGGLVATGAKLITSNDCTTCHREREALIGPAYAAVAKKYESNEANITALANKVIQGGKGNWGEIAMTPHPNLSLDDAKEMTKYILSLK